MELIGTILAMFKFPVVRVPVLSSITVSIFPIVSIERPDLTQTPYRAEFAIDAMKAVGTLNTRAQGHATTKMVIDRYKFCVITHTIKAMQRIIGAKN